MDSLFLECYLEREAAQGDGGEGGEDQLVHLCNWNVDYAFSYN